MVLPARLPVLCGIRNNYFCGYRISSIASAAKAGRYGRAMKTSPDIANAIIDGLGGTTSVHKLTGFPTSTIHSWRSEGIPRTRLKALKGCADAEERPIPQELTAELEQLAA